MRVACSINFHKFRGLAPIEIIGAVFCNAFKSRRQLRLTEDFTLAHVTEELVKIDAIIEPIVYATHISDGNFVWIESIGRQSDSRCNDIGPRECSKALVCRPESGDCTGNACSQATDESRLFDQFPVLIEVHVTVRRKRRPFPVIEKRVFAIHMDQHESAAADIARVRNRDRQGESGCDSRVHRVATGTKNIFAYLCRKLVRDC